MPNLPCHFNFALETLAAMDDPSVEGHIGSFLLGCTTPDIRAMTKWTRDHTHFAPRRVERVGVGTEGLFGSYPGLLAKSRQSEATRAFIAGYISHLTTDETWITQIYQPYFGDRELFPNSVEANIWDRAVQLDLDRAAWEQGKRMDRVIQWLEKPHGDVEVGFIDSQTLWQWRTWVTDFSRRPFNWDRLHFLAQRMYRENEEAHMIVESFISALHDNLNRVYSKVPRKKVQAFREEAVGQSVRLIKDYLNGA